VNLLLRGILSKAWAIDNRFISANVSLINSLLEGESIDLSGSLTFSSASVIDKSGLRSNTKLSNAPEGSIAVIDLQGPLMKYDQECGPAGTASVSSWIKQADSNPNIVGIILKTDSPGGTVDGTEELARTIASTKKPIVGYVDGLAASAAYWAVSQTDEIIANGKTSEVGSIGTMASWADMKPIFEKAGVKFHEVYASKSTDKNKIFREAMQGEYDGLIQELDQLNEVFHASVRKGRPNAKDSTFSGAMYLSAEAKKLGLIDSIGTMDDAIKAIQRLKSKNTMKKNTAETHPNLCTALGFENGFESNEEGVHLSAEHIDTLETSLANGAKATADLATANATIATLQAQPDANAEALTAAQTELSTANQTIATLQAELTEFKSKPAHNGGAPAGGIDDLPEAEKGTAYLPNGLENKLANIKYKPQ
jgi:signal peptide peptidase SppA